MNDPKQLWLFNYMDKEYDDMESDDYDEAYANYLFDNANDQDNDIEFNLHKNSSFLCEGTYFSFD